MMKRLFTFTLLSLLGSCGAETTEDPGENGGNTNWLKPCDAEADCDDEDACIANVCLKPCDGAAACAPLAGAECASINPVRIDETGSCNSPGPASFCSLTCDGDEDCADAGDAYACESGVCKPSCDGVPNEPSPTPEPTPEPSPEPSMGEPEPSPEPSVAPVEPEPGPSNPGPSDECLIAMDVSECCPQAFAARRSELESFECWYEVGPGDTLPPEGIPESCYPSCVDLPCPPAEVPGIYGVAVEDGGACALEPACDDASCPGSPCDPEIGCASTFAGAAEYEELQCQADACGEPGICVIGFTYCDDIYQPVCGCDGVTYENRCSAGGVAPILHEGECEEPIPEPSPEPDPAIDECVVAIDGSGCCPEPTAMRRSELEADPCSFEYVNGDLSPWNEIPGECLQLCPAIPCPSLDPVMQYGVATEEGGSCTIVPACEDGSCPSSPCDPRVGCSPDWTCDTPNCSAESTLVCQASACGEPGSCTIVEPRTCEDVLEPVCGCDGVTYDNACRAAPGAIDYEGECGANDAGL